LLTGFEPFGDSEVNPSEQVVQRLAAEGIDGVSLQTAILPVDQRAGPATLRRAVEAGHPDAVLCLGEAGRRLAISIERIAINLMDYRIADNAGNQVVDSAICPDGPAAYFVTLPVQAMYRAVVAAGVPGELSLSAGTFLCNQVTYELLHYLSEHRPATPAGFIHLPLLPEQAAARRPLLPSMSVATMTIGIRAAIQAIRGSL
jgi:pyroglutamyl-peptidase